MQSPGFALASQSRVFYDLHAFLALDLQLSRSGMIHSSSIRCDWLHATTLALGCVMLCAGCAAPWSMQEDTEPLSLSHTSSDALPSMPITTEQPATIVNRVAQTKPAPILTTDQEIALNNLVAEVRRTRMLDPGVEHELRSQLRQSPQDEWPLVVKQFNSARAYREELLARESQQADEFQRVSHTTQFPPLPKNSESINSNKSDVQRLQAAVTQAEGVHLASHIAPVAHASDNEALPVRGTTLANHSAESLATPIPMVNENPHSIQQAAHIVAADSDWKAQLAASIDTMQREVKTSPGSTEELQEHMRLRMLMLMAGRENDSLAPIPGASTTEQDYWSKQLFALSTYFDTSRQPDMKQRAAGSLVHLDAARAKLAELATLQIRNFTFVDSVDGYGLYKPHADAKFKSGDQANLYAEIENFRSDSTKDGYRTTLATSYEVVDPQGRRVDGAQFPDVEDICKRERRDFHMQYGVALPTKIYPGKYELRLSITDQLSNKIGQATLPFEIVE